MASRRRRWGPKGWLTATLVWYALVAAVVGLVIGVHAEVAQSSYVQAHGVRDSATVTDVYNHEGSGRDATWEAQVTVDLQQPVDGATRSVVHVPYKDNSVDGDTITVLVDPRDPGYSELPGSAYGNNTLWISSLVGLSVTLVIALLFTYQTITLFRQRRATRALATKS
jgi:hypothetical protein